MDIFVPDVDLSAFPRRISLIHGKEKGREWWEWWKGERGLVIQRLSPRLPWFVFFQEGDAIRCLERRLTEEERERGVVAVFCSSKSLTEICENLKLLGFDVSLDGGEK